ncbi:hypothetical protein LDY98_15185, partial [Pseudomonas aeruginosa]|nr:hypothetical protein [Pseudomonas aeruginosa]
MTLNFPLLLVIAVAVCGALALVDLVLFAPRRRAAISSYEGQVNTSDGNGGVIADHLGGDQSGNFELNVMLPLVADNLLHSIQLLAN